MPKPIQTPKKTSDVLSSLLQKTVSTSQAITSIQEPAKANISALETECLQAFLRNDFEGIVTRVRAALLAKDTQVTAKVLLIFGVCLRRLEQNEEAYATFIALAPRIGDLQIENQLDVLDGLTACAIAAGQVSAASSYGKQALEARAQVFVKSPLAWADDWQAQLSSPDTAGYLNVVSYSLYGHKPVYTEMLIINLAAAKVLYQGWQVWVYVDETVPVQARERLQASGAFIKPVTAEDKKLPGTTWRFLAMEDPSVKVVVFRDADSYITPRETACVRDWLQRGTAVHAIRDWYTHSELMLAGMSGARAAGFRRIRSALTYFVSRPFTPSHGDQHFLRKYVWPYAQHSVTVHDTVFAPSGSVPVPHPAPSTLAAHVGNRLSRFVSFDVTDVVGKLPVTMALNMDLYAGQHFMGNYEVTAKEGIAVVELPNLIDEQRKAGHFSFKFSKLSNV